MNLHHKLTVIDTFDQTLQRFESLRGYGRLPRGRENAALRLTDEQIAHAILGFVPILPGWAGHVSLIMGDLRPVGGARASFLGSQSLVAALAQLIGNRKACDSVFSITFSIARKSGNDEYHAKIMFKKDDKRFTASFVSKMAYSLLADGAEINYDHDSLFAPTTRQLCLGREFFNDMQSDVELSRNLDRPFKTDWQEYLKEEDRENFHHGLGARSGSNFLNVGVDTQVTWPKEPTRVLFADHHFVLFPKTRDNSHSISVDLVLERISHDEAITLMNRFLSLVSWCDDRHAILRDGWSGNPVPQPVPRRNLGFSTANHWLFNRSISEDTDLLQRLAYYREGLNAHESSIVSFEVLSFYKVFEVRANSKRGEPNPTKAWIEKVFSNVSQTLLPEELEAFHKARGSQSIQAYIFENYRVATAHTSRNFPSDADSSIEITRLHIGAAIMKALARYFIQTRYEFSTSYFDDIPAKAN